MIAIFRFRFRKVFFPILALIPAELARGFLSQPSINSIFHKLDFAIPRMLRQMPLILPGVISGGLFALITSFDAVVVVLFVGSNGQKTLPWQMFTGLREQISPTILAVATVLVAISILFLTIVELLRSRSERLRGISAQYLFDRHFRSGILRELIMSGSRFRRFTIRVEAGNAGFGGMSIIFTAPCLAVSLNGS